MRIRLRWSGLLVASWLIFACASLAQDKPNLFNEPLEKPGVIPVGEDGQPLNLSFEDGTLKDWTATGDAFNGQPIKGEIDPKRPYGVGKKADHTGQYWIGTFEKLLDKPKGTLSSKPFKVTEPFASFLLAGGNHPETRLELVLLPDPAVKDSQERVISTSRGTNTESLRPMVVDLTPHLGKLIYIRLVDDHSGGWGHINFDDFRLHAARPKFREAPRGPVNVPNTSAPALEQLYPHAGLTAAEAVKQMQVPPGFKVEVGASEPDVNQPIAMAIDDRGRVWIAEAYEYPVRAPEGKGRDRILIFEDTDLNGSLDKRTIFAEKLNLVSGMELGFGGVWVGAAPYLLFIPDKNGDDVPDSEPQILLDGWGQEDTHETLNSFIWGPDGWLYGCHGVFTHSLVGKPGTPKDKRVPLNAGVWRYHPTRHEFEVFAHGTSNPWGLDFNEQGQAFVTACVIPHLYHIIPGARYQRQAGQHFNPHTYDDIKTIAVHRHYVGNQWNTDNRRQSDELGGGHAHAGAMIYLGGSWPEKYRNQIIMNNIHGNRMNVDLLTQKGSGYEGNFAPDFLFTRDQWSQMLYMTYGPDGQVWVIDWYDRNQCHHKNTEGHDRTNGRIYRISYNDAKPVKVDLQKCTDEELTAYLTNPNQWYQRHAQRILQERYYLRGRSEPNVRPIDGDLSARDAVAKLALQSENESHALRGLWTLRLTGGLTKELGLKLLSHPSAAVRGWTIRLQSERAGTFDHEDLGPRWLELAKEQPGSRTVRLELASAAKRMDWQLTLPLVEALLTHGEDATDHNLPLMYWYGLEQRTVVDEQRVLAIAMGARDRFPKIADYMVRRLGSTPEKSLELLLTGLGSTDDAGRQLAFLRGLNVALQGRGKVVPPEIWKTVAAKLANVSDPDLKRQTTILALTFGDAAAAISLRRIAADPSHRLAERQAALAALLSVKDDELGPMLAALLTDPAMRAVAIRGLATLDDPKTPARLLDVYDKFSVDERRDVLATLCSRASFAKELLSAIEAKRVPANHLTADLVVNLRNLKDAGLQAQLEKVWGSSRETAADKALLITQYKSLLASPPAIAHDVQLGRAVFARTCQQCHTLFGTGGKVGPDLTGSNRANLDYLLSNVIDPSAVMAKEYQPTVLLLSNGRVVTGILKEENDATVTVQLPTELLTIAKSEIEERKISANSMMPDDLLRPLSQHESRSLVAYLASSGQVPQLANNDTAGSIFNGKDLSGWISGDMSLWSVEDGEIVGRTTGLKRNHWLTSQYSLRDFRFSVDVKLARNEGNSGIQFRSEPIANGEVKGYQADIGAGWWGKLYEEHGRALLWKESGEKHVKLGDWNKYEILAVGSRVQTWINGQKCVDLDDPTGSRQGVIALQLHSGGATEVRYKNFQVSIPTGSQLAVGYPASKPNPAGKLAGKITFKKTTLDQRFRSEGVAMGDFNNDGKLDIAAGSVWYEAPGSPGDKSGWKMHAITPQPNEFNIKTYGDTFCNWAEDFNGDGRQDLLVVDFPGKPTWWFENPGNTDTPWPKHRAVPVTNNESPQYADVDGDGQRELIFGEASGKLALARPAKQPNLDWRIQPIAAEANPNIQKFYHGLGVGDLNKDGKLDLFTPNAWFAQPADKATAEKEPWQRTDVKLGPAQAHMYAYDFDGDGDADIVGTSAHRTGIWWYEQTDKGFVQHEIENKLAQTHALILADINGDGLPDLVTGKRFYAHNGNDPGEDEPPVIAWYELSRDAGQPKWTRHEIDDNSGVGTQFEVHDMNGDGWLDVIVANKRGVFYLEQVRE
ncbi:FG-GAP repeat protein [Anatilimnocola aggregata]|uniref:FG-GAP repeat protein n=1 Tax=Anatilimnocola aggregata TaxID=2528021 RepID=A0A517YIA6_9BACT|nr:PVC-type heme-binding CxxCH protein [Anatilimnocola aggregata]QDU29944.1 FG-GAP repeat protein [Anatilimnocola aggregata]